MGQLPVLLKERSGKYARIIASEMEFTLRALTEWTTSASGPLWW